MTDLKLFLSNLTEEEKERLVLLLAQSKNNKDEDLLLSKLPNSHHCPFCKGNKVRKNGRQQMYCRDCNKYYTLKTNTIFFSSKKPLTLWKRYIDLMIEGKSLRYIAKELNISLQTSFYWRHKILSVLRKNDNDNNNKLDGIIEADETYFNESQKGNKNITNRKPRKRGFSSENRIVGLSHNKVCVLTAIDRNKKSFGIPVGFGKVNKEEVENLQIHLKKDSILITDGDKSYQTLKNIKLKSLKFGKPQDKVYHLNNINNYHSQLKKFMVRFNGVATKFLDYYVEYFNSLKQQIDIFASLFNTDMNYKVCNIRTKRVCFENPFVRELF
ncbi:MAG: IS1595 family transposase [Rickettsiales bacterium]|nr:IS1595 family transposase [Rickettsiales bacterium]